MNSRRLGRHDEGAGPSARSHALAVACAILLAACWHDYAGQPRWPGHAGRNGRTDGGVGRDGVALVQLMARWGLRPAAGRPIPLGRGTTMPGGARSLHRWQRHGRRTGARARILRMPSQLTARWRVISWVTLNNGAWVLKSNAGGTVPWERPMWARVRRLRECHRKSSADGVMSLRHFETLARGVLKLDAAATAPRKRRTGAALTNT